MYREYPGLAEYLIRGKPDCWYWMFHLARFYRFKAFSTWRWRCRCRGEFKWSWLRPNLLRVQGEYKYDRDECYRLLCDECIPALLAANPTLSMDWYAVEARQ